MQQSIGAPPLPAEESKQVWYRDDGNYDAEEEEEDVHRSRSDVQPRLGIHNRRLEDTYGPLTTTKKEVKYDVFYVDADAGRPVDIHNKEQVQQGIINSMGELQNEYNPLALNMHAADKFIPLHDPIDHSLERTQIIPTAIQNTMQPQTLVPSQARQAAHPVHHTRTVKGRSNLKSRIVAPALAGIEQARAIPSNVYSSVIGDSHGLQAKAPTHDSRPSFQQPSISRLTTSQATHMHAQGNHSGPAFDAGASPMTVVDDRRGTVSPWQHSPMVMPPSVSIAHNNILQLQQRLWQMNQQQQYTQHLQQQQHAQHMQAVLGMHPSKQHMAPALQSLPLPPSVTQSGQEGLMNMGTTSYMQPSMTRIEQQQPGLHMPSSQQPQRPTQIVNRALAPLIESNSKTPSNRTSVDTSQSQQVFQRAEQAQLMPDNPHPTTNTTALSTSHNEKLSGIETRMQSLALGSGQTTNITHAHDVPLIDQAPWSQQQNETSQTTKPTYTQLTPQQYQPPASQTSLASTTVTQWAMPTASAEKPSSAQLVNSQALYGRTPTATLASEHTQDMVSQKPHTAYTGGSRQNPTQEQAWRPQTSQALRVTPTTQNWPASLQGSSALAFDPSHAPAQPPARVPYPSYAGPLSNQGPSTSGTGAPTVYPMHYEQPTLAAFSDKPVYPLFDYATSQQWQHPPHMPPPQYSPGMDMSKPGLAAWQQHVVARYAATAPSFPYVPSAFAPPMYQASKLPYMSAYPSFSPHTMHTSVPSAASLHAQTYMIPSVGQSMPTLMQPTLPVSQSLTGMAPGHLSSRALGVQQPVQFKAEGPTNTTIHMSERQGRETQWIAQPHQQISQIVQRQTSAATEEQHATHSEQKVARWMKSMNELMFTNPQEPRTGAASQQSLQPEQPRRESVMNAQHTHVSIATHQTNPMYLAQQGTDKDSHIYRTDNAQVDEQQAAHGASHSSIQKTHLKHTEPSVSVTPRVFDHRRERLSHLSGIHTGLKTVPIVKPKILCDDSRVGKTDILPFDISPDQQSQEMDKAYGFTSEEDSENEQ